MRIAALSGIQLSWRFRVTVLVLAHFTCLAWLGLSRHWGYRTSLKDVGVFDQAVWGLLHGAPFLNTSVYESGPMNWLGLHFNPVLALFAPLYALAPATEWFALAQALALSWAAWPIFLLTSRLANSEAVGATWAVVYLVNPFLLNAAAWDFHPVALAVPFLALALLAIYQRDGRLLVLSCLPLLLIQEQMGLTVAGLGVLWGLRHGFGRISACWIVVGLTHFVIVLGIAMPMLSPTRQHIMLSKGMGQLSRYDWLGASPGAMVETLLFQPLWVAERVFRAMDGASYLVMLLLPVLGAPIASLAFLLPGMPDLAANLLSANPMPRGWESYHSVTLIPLVTVAAAFGIRRISERLRTFGQLGLVCLVAASSLISGYMLAPLPLPGMADFWSPSANARVPDTALASVLNVLPPEASVSAQANVGAHFSQRREIYCFPEKAGAADVVILRLDSPTRRLHPDLPIYLGTLAHHLQMQPESYIATVEELLASPHYKVLVWNDPWLVLSRTGDDAYFARREVSAKLVALRQDWSGQGTHAKAIEGSAYRVNQ